MTELDSIKECITLLKERERTAKQNAKRLYSQKERSGQLLAAFKKSGTLSIEELTVLEEEANSLKLAYLEQLEEVALTHHSRKTVEHHLILLNLKETIEQHLYVINFDLKQGVLTQTLTVVSLLSHLMRLGECLSEAFKEQGECVDDQSLVKSGIRAEDLGVVLAQNKSLFNNKIEINEKIGHVLNVIDECSLQLMSDWVSSRGYDKSSQKERDTILRHFDNLAKGKQAYFNLMDYNAPPSDHRPDPVLVRKHRLEVFYFCLGGRQHFELSEAFRVINTMVTELQTFASLGESQHLSQLKEFVRQFQHFEISKQEFSHLVATTVLNMKNELYPSLRQIPIFSEKQKDSRELFASIRYLRRLKPDYFKAIRSNQINRLILSYQVNFFQMHREELNENARSRSRINLNDLVHDYINDRKTVHELRAGFFNLYHERQNQRGRNRLNPLSCSKRREEQMFRQMSRELNTIKERYQTI